MDTNIGSIKRREYFLPKYMGEIILIIISSAMTLYVAFYPIYFLITNHHDYKTKSMESKADSQENIDTPWTRRKGGKHLLGGSKISPHYLCNCICFDDSIFAHVENTARQYCRSVNHRVSSRSIWSYFSWWLVFMDKDSYLQSGSRLPLPRTRLLFIVRLPWRPLRWSLRNTDAIGHLSGEPLTYSLIPNNHDLWIQ